MTWYFAALLEQEILNHPTSSTALCLKLEVSRLGKQKCGYCSGFGHSGNDCATDAKLAQLRMGVREQT